MNNVIAIAVYASNLIWIQQIDASLNSHHFNPLLNLHVTVLNESCKKDLIEQLSYIVLDALNDTFKCSFVYILDNYYTSVIDKINELQNSKEEKLSDNFITSHAIFLKSQFENETQIATNVRELSDLLLSVKKERCLHYVFMMRNSSSMVNLVESLLSPSLHLRAKFIIILHKNNGEPANKSSIEGMIERSPFTKIVNVLFIGIEGIIEEREHSSSTFSHIQKHFPKFKKTLYECATHTNFGINFYTNVFFTNGRRCQGVLLGYWKNRTFVRNKTIETFRESLAGNNKWFPEKLKNFHNFQLKVTTFNYPPSVIFEGINGSSENNDGLEVRLLKTIASALNFDFVMSYPKDDDKWGKLFNGSWTGSFGELIREEADVSFANYFITADRLLILDMTIPYHIDYTCFITPIPRPPPKYYVVVHPFQFIVWGAILLTLIILPIAISLSSSFEESRWFSTMRNSLLYTVGLILNKTLSYKINPTTLPMRILMGSVSLGTFVLGVAYMSSLFSMLLLPSVGRPVNSLSELLKSGLSWGVRDSGGWETWFSNSIDPIAQRIYEGFQYVHGIDEGICQVLDGHFAFMNSGTFLRYLVASNFTDEFGQAQLHVTKECVIPFRIGLALPKYSVYTSKFDSVIEKIVEAGMVNQWFKNLLEMASKQRFTDTADQMNGKAKNSNSPSKILGLYDLQGAFYLLLIGWFVSSLFLVAETFKKRVNESSTRKHNIAGDSQNARGN